MKTLTQFINNSRLSESMIRAVVRQCGGWESFCEMASDVANHGAGGGFNGFVYYSDTVTFAKRHKAVILEACKEIADDIGESGAYSMIAGFNCLKDMELTGDTVADAIHSSKHKDKMQIMNALSLFALEEVSRSYADQ